MRAFFLLIFASFLLADTPYLVSSFDKQADMQEHTQYLIDSEKNHSLSDVLESNVFEPMPKKSLGIHSYVVWTRLALHNDTNQTRSFIMANMKPAIDKLDVYILDDKRVVSEYKIGDARAIENRPIHHRHSVIPLEILPGETLSVFARCENIGALEGGWIVLDSNSFVKLSITESMLLGAFGGLMLALIFYNLIMYFSLKERAFLIYTLYGLSAFVYQYIMSGVFYEWSIFSMELLNLLTCPLGYSMIVFVLLFNSAFFQTKKELPKLYMTTTVLAITMALLTLLIFYVQYTEYLFVYTQLLNSLILLSLLILFLSGVYFIFKRKNGALFYTLGQGTFFLMIAYQLMNYMGLVQTSMFMLYATMVGIFVDMIFLSIALGYKVNHIRKEKEKSEKILILSSRFASMGQVVGNITHQWKIPLVRLGALLTELEASVWSRSENLEKSVTQTVPKMRETLRFMDETIEEFASFYKSDSVEVSFDIYEQIEEVEHLLMAKCIALDFSVFIDESCNERYFGYKNAFTQVIMILFDNTLEVAKERAIKSAKIEFSLKRKHKGFELYIEDNCGGVQQKPLETIFELFESNEKQSQSGMGLAIAKKMIEEKMDGKIRVQNTQRGAKFTLFLGSF